MKRMKRKNISNGIRRAAVIIVAVLVFISCGIDCEKEKVGQKKPSRIDKPVVITTNNTYTGRVTVYDENMVFDYAGEMEITGLPGKEVEIIINTEVEHESGTK